MNRRGRLAPRPDRVLSDADLRIRDALVLEFHAFAMAIARRIELPPYMERADAIGAAMIGLLRAAEDWRSGRGTTFKVYAGHAIRFAVLLERRTQRRWMVGDFIARHGVDPWGRVLRHPSFIARQGHATRRAKRGEMQREDGRKESKGSRRAGEKSVSASNRRAPAPLLAPRRPSTREVNDYLDFLAETAAAERAGR